MPRETITRLRCKQGTSSTWNTANTVLLLAEMGYENDTGRFKFGDGVTGWNSLAYYSLANLGDVGVTTPTNRFVLVADGDSWEARLLVEADISDLQAYLTTVQLSDNTDVGSSTPTNRNALMADGDSWESRAVVEADISDLKTYATFEKDVFQITFTSDGGGTVTVDTTEDTLAYTKVGDLVTVQGDVLVDSVDNPSGDLIMNGLPHMSAVLQENADRVVAPTYSQNLKSPLKDEWSAGIIEPGQTTVLILQADGSSLAANVEAGSKFFFNFSYISGQSITIGQVVETDLAQQVTVVQP